MFRPVQKSSSGTGCKYVRDKYLCTRQFELRSLRSESFIVETGSYCCHWLNINSLQFLLVTTRKGARSWLRH
jgi:hypothetical protein